MKWVWCKGLIVRLSGKGIESAEEKKLPEDLMLKLMGGRALGDYVYTMLAGPTTTPLSPENPLIIAPGLLLGSGLTTASKTIVVARSPLTGLLGRSAAGAKLGWELRRLGYDFLAITGALEEPGVLVLDADGPRVEKATELWGLRIGEARSKLRSAYRGYTDAIIGPAGEKLSAIAMIDFNLRQAGRTGLGAVMGSKKLKAILVKGYTNPEPANMEEARKIIAELNRQTLEDPASKRLMEYGTPIMTQFTGGALGVLPSLNWKQSTLTWCQDPEKALSELSEFAPKRRISRNPCPFCGRACSQVIKVERVGVEVDGPEYETVYSLGTNLGICNISDIAYLNYLADELGFDTISLGGTIAWAIEAGERGLLKDAPSWGDIDAIASLVEDMAERRGFLGELLAEGVRKAVERLGEGGEFALHVKGLEPPAYDVRGLKGLALGFAVSTRGADHLTSASYAVEIPGSLWMFEKVDRLSYKGKGVMVKELEDLMGFYDNTGICKFSRRTLLPETVAPVVSELLGITVTPGQLLESGSIAVNIERLVNIAYGASSSDDNLPPRLEKEPIVEGPSKGELVDPASLEHMKTEYYMARGWSTEGVPLKVTLLRLGLLDKLPKWLLDKASGTP